jgi:hypothetical protein
MNLRTLFKLAVLPTLLTITLNANGQSAPKIKYFETTTIDQVQIDFDNDGDLDLIIAGVNADRNQGRVYLVENRGGKLGKPEYIYSFPSIAVKQELRVSQDKDVTTINIEGTSPNGDKRNYVGTLVRGAFEGMIAPPITADIRE